MKRIVLVSGTSNQPLTQKIGNLLEVNLVNPNIQRFANGEIYCEIDRNVRGADVFLVQSTSAPVNDNIMELLIVIDALKRASPPVLMSLYLIMDIHAKTEKLVLGLQYRQSLLLTY